MSSNWRIPRNLAGRHRLCRRLWWACQPRWTTTCLQCSSSGAETRRWWLSLIRPWQNLNIRHDLLFQSQNTKAIGEMQQQPRRGTLSHLFLSSTNLTWQKWKASGHDNGEEPCIRRGGENYNGSKSKFFNVCTLSRTLNAIRMSSSSPSPAEFSILIAIMLQNSGNSIWPLPSSSNSLINSNRSFSKI